MPLHVFGHIQPYDAVLITKQSLRQCLGQFRFTNPSWSEEDEGPNGPLGIFQTGVGPTYRLGNGVDRFLLPDYPSVQYILKIEEADCLFFGNVGNGNAGPVRHNLRNILSRNYRVTPSLAAPPFAAQGLQFFF